MVGAGPERGERVVDDGGPAVQAERLRDPAQPQLVQGEVHAGQGEHGEGDLVGADPGVGQGGPNAGLDRGAGRLDAGVLQFEVSRLAPMARKSPPVSATTAWVWEPPPSTPRIASIVTPDIGAGPPGVEPGVWRRSSPSRGHIWGTSPSCIMTPATSGWLLNSTTFPSLTQAK